jgi:DNA-binding response OmpR family regulator
MGEMHILPRVLILSPASNNRKEVHFDHEMIDALAQAGFQLWLSTEMDEALSVLAEDHNYIVVIDHNENGEADRFRSTSGIRAKFRGGIVLFVGPSSDDRQRGLSGGADVVISSPKRHAELIAYLYALHRRVTILSAMSGPAATRQKNGRDEAEDAWVLEQDGRILRAPNGAKILLSRAEHRFLIDVFEDSDNMLRRDRWHGLPSISQDFQREFTHRSLDVLVSRLRKKIAAADVNFPLHAKHGIGYQFLGKCFVDYGRQASLDSLGKQDQFSDKQH